MKLKRKENSMTNAMIYIKAAKQVIKKGQYCCPILHRLDIETTAFERMFKPRSRELDEYFGRICLYSWFGFNGSKENQLARSLSLLFMAEMENDK